MNQTNDSGFDVQQLMAEIRQAVAQREAEGKTLVSESRELRDLLSMVVSEALQHSEVRSLNLQQDFVASEADHYCLDDLLQYHDQTFVWNAYLAILKREPDEPGLRQFLGKLRSGCFNKIDVLASLRFSPEGVGRNVRVDGLGRRRILRRLHRVPVVGHLLRWSRSRAPVDDSQPAGV